MRTLRLDLTDGWAFRPADAPDVWTPATVPGSVQADLLAAGRLPDPFVGTHEADVAWVAETDWVYRLRFDAPEPPSADAQAALVFEGLDTFATVTLNGRAVGTADNMFRPWRFDVTEALAAGENELVVRFDSPVRRAEAVRAAYGEDLPTVARNKLGPYVRKAPCHFGWDWGPEILTVGPWRPVRLEMVPAARLAALDAWGEPADDGTATLGAGARAEGPRRKGLRLRLRVTDPDGAPAGDPVDVPLGADGAATAALRLPEPRLWWPAGMGDQPLYTAEVALVAEDGTVVDAETVRVGVRHLEVDRGEDAWGRAFTFRVNGRPMFAKGANWIPADALPTRLTRGRYRRLLADCRAIGMNMLRVWGGGFYEDPAFYDLCDELGLLVWQDFMFSCAMYPGDDDAFVEACRAEAAWAVTRLRRHACLALWCGNNEMEWGWRQWGWVKKWPAHLWDGYVRLFHEMLPAVCAENDPRRQYVPSSPHGLAPEDANGPAAGDAHVWTVWFGSMDGRTYGESGHRFVSEFGFQSLPSLETLGPVIPEGELAVDSPAMLNHQKSPSGNEKIAGAVAAWFGTPRDFDALVYLSQAYQARTLALGVEHWRRSAPRTMGALYWQANDCWPVASWASLDYAGRWKALHYAAARFFAPHLVSGLAGADGARVWVTGDPAAGTVDAEVRLQVLAWDGRPLETRAVAVRIERGQAREAASVTWSALGTNAAEAYLAADLVIGGARVGRTLLLPAPPVEVGLPDPGLDVEAVAEDGAPAVRVTCRNVALAVWLEAPGLTGRFADNGFDLLPGEARTVRFLAEDDVDAAAFAAALAARSACDAVAADGSA